MRNYTESQAKIKIYIVYQDYFSLVFKPSLHEKNIFVQLIFDLSPAIEYFFSMYT